MSHLDTAYKLGAAQAIHTFNAWMNKQAQGIRAPGTFEIPAPTTVTRGSPAEAVRGSAASGLAASTGSQTQVPMGLGAGKMQTFSPMNISRSAPVFGQAPRPAAASVAPRAAIGPLARR